MTERSGTPERLVVHWRIDGRSGHGKPIDAAAARATVEHLNVMYGHGTHWVEEAS